MTTPLNHAIGDITLSAAKPILEKGVKKIIERVNETDNKITEHFEINGKETSIICPERLQKYSLLLEVKKNSFFKNTLEFRNGFVKRVTLQHDPTLIIFNVLTIFGRRRTIHQTLRKVKVWLYHE